MTTAHYFDDIQLLPGSLMDDPERIYKLAAAISCHGIASAYQRADEAGERLEPDEKAALTALVRESLTDRFNRLDGLSDPRERVWVGECACGTEVVLSEYEMLTGSAYSCGCSPDLFHDAVEDGDHHV